MLHNCNNTAKLGNMRCGRCQDWIDREREHDTKRDELASLIAYIRYDLEQPKIADALQNIAERI